MEETLRLLAVLAHPDDEAMGLGGTLARYAAEGVETFLVTATRGERGWTGPPEADPGPVALGAIREAELRASAAVLGIRAVTLLDYVDGDLDRADPAVIVGDLVAHLRAVRPQVVVTFGPDGAYGHPDHIAICQFTTAAVVAAADASYAVPGAAPPHRVTKLYYYVLTALVAAAFRDAFGEQVMAVDGIERQPSPWPEWAITTRDASAAYWRTAWAAVACHRSQLPMYETLAALPPEAHTALWASPIYYRAFSLVNGGRAVETDLFAGLRSNGG